MGSLPPIRASMRQLVLKRRLFKPRIANSSNINLKTCRGERIWTSVPENLGLPARFCSQNGRGVSSLAGS
jgi:hypothetical protein